MRYLFVAAHPDDECDGAGATIHKLTGLNAPVAVAFLAGGAEARRNLSSCLSAERDRALSALGVSRVYSASFPNIQMNTEPFSAVVRFVRQCVEDWQPDIVVTHHPSDINNDHMITSMAVSEAISGNRSIGGYYYMESSSATEWALNPNIKAFHPDVFVEADREGLEVKLRALEEYSGVMRPYPHPQSREACYALAALRGSQAGLNYAEAFKCVFRRIR